MDKSSGRDSERTASSTPTPPHAAAMSGAPARSGAEPRTPPVPSGSSKLGSISADSPVARPPHQRSEGSPRPTLGPRAQTAFVASSSARSRLASAEERRGAPSDSIGTILSSASRRASTAVVRDPSSSSASSDEAGIAVVTATSPRSPGAVSSSGSASAGFIYPIKSAVSVKPSTGDVGMASPRGRTNTSGSSDKRHSQSSNEDQDVGSASAAAMRRVSSDPSQAGAGGSPLEPEEEISGYFGKMHPRGASLASMSDSHESERPRSSASVGDGPCTPGSGRLGPKSSETVSSASEWDTRSALASKEEAALERDRERLEQMTQTRFRHVETADGHMVVTGRDNELTRCEDEPIHIPGAVQGFGCMVVVREDDDGNLVVRQASENTTELLGLSPAYLFKLTSFLDCLDDEQADLLWETIESLEDSEHDVSEVAPRIFQLTGWGQPGAGAGHARARRQWQCWCALHRPVLNAGAIVDGPPMTILEFEPLDDQVNPLSPPVSRPKAEQRRSGMRERNNGSSTAGESKGSKGSKGSKDSNGGGSGGTVGRARGPDEFSGSTLEAPEEEGTPANSPTGGEGRSTSSVATPRSSSPRPMITTIDSDGLTVTGTAEHVPLDTDAGPGGLEGEAFVPSHEAFLESTESTSRPIRALHRMHSDQDGSSRRRPRPTRGSRGAGPGLANRGEGTGGGGPQMLDMFGVLSQVNEQLSAQSDLNGFLKVVVSIIREVTGFGRVMVYQFDEAWNGQVVCELVDWQETHDLYRGLHFPATDIPKQARDLYLINKVRLLYDRDQPSARMVCRTQEDLAHPVDMTHSFLRAMSPIHIKYLANMGVRASMSISIVAFDQLWGLIALHTYGSHGKRVAFPMRQLCRLIGESVSRNIERLSYTRRLSARKLINTLPTDQNPSGYIISNAEDLLKLFDADFGVIAIGNEAKILGPLSASQEVLGCTEYLRIKKFQRVIVSQDVSKDFPDMVLPKGLEVIAGILLVPLSNSGIDFIAFLRKAQTRSVNWAGKPFKEGKENSAVLEPRKSFKIWSETVTGTCRAWKDEELETAGVLCLVYGKFISVWRQREQAMQYNQLNKLLLSNASHEVRTPLNHIINYLEMALDGNLDEDTRDHLSKSHMASKSLLFVINDLLDLTRQEQGNKLFLQEPFDLAATVREAVEMHQWEAKRRKIDFSVDTQPETCMVLGDKNRIRSILINTVTNSVKHTSEGHIHVEMRKRASMELSELPEDCDMEIELVVSDSGTGIPREKLESIFREFEQVESVIAEPKLSQDGKPEERSATEDLELGATADAAAAQESGSALGLGLAVVARIVRNLGGQLRVDSTVGEGSRFTYFLPFRSADHLQGVSEPQRGGGSSQGGSGTSMRRSNSLGSDGSQASSNKSEINSLVEAISASHLDSHNSDGAQAGPDSARGKEPGGRKNAGMVGSLSSSAGRSRPDLQRMQSSADSSGSRPIAGSSIPLRSVKIDPHELDSLPQSPRQADSRRQHGERRSSREHDRRRSGVTRNTAEATGGTAGPSASPTVHAQDHEPTAHTQNVEGPTVTAAPDSPSSGLAQTSRREPPPGRVNVKAVNRDAAASGHMNNDSGSDATPPDGRSPGSASGGARHSGARSRRLAAAQKARTSPAVTPAAPPQKLAPLRVLVVEDDPINRAILAKRLGKDNHTVLLAVNGEEGVRVFEEQGDSIDVVLMDLQMPICNGQDACVRIREAERKRTDSRTLAGRPAAHILNGCIPILAVSATLSYDMREEIAELGFDGWLLKPIDFKRLHSLLKSLTHPEHRQTEQWKPGHAWEKGGWLSVPPSRAQDDDGGDEAGSPAA